MGKSIKKITAPLGKASVLTRAIDPLNLSGADQSGFLPGMPLGAADLLEGKHKSGTADRYTELDPLQQKALGKYGEMLNTDTDQIAKNSVAKQENQILANSSDAARNATGLVASHGLGNSSVGLNAIINTGRTTGTQIGAARAALPGIQYDMKTANLNSASNGINGILNGRSFIQGQSGSRGGGLLDTIAPFAGAIGSVLGK